MRCTRQRREWLTNNIQTQPPSFISPHPSPSPLPTPIPFYTPRQKAHLPSSTPHSGSRTRSSKASLSCLASLLFGTRPSSPATSSLRKTGTTKRKPSAQSSAKRLLEGSSIVQARTLARGSFGSGGRRTIPLLL